MSVIKDDIIDSLKIDVILCTEYLSAKLFLGEKCNQLLQFSSGKLHLSGRIGYIVGVLK